MLEQEQKILVAEMEKFLEKHEVKHLYADVVERIVLLIIAALGLIAALSWDKALHHIFEKLFHGDTLAGDVGYAVIVTVIAAVISVQLGKFLQRRK